MFGLLSPESAVVCKPESNHWSGVSYKHFLFILICVVNIIVLINLVLLSVI